MCNWNQGPADIKNDIHEAIDKLKNVNDRALGTLDNPLTLVLSPGLMGVLGVKHGEVLLDPCGSRGYVKYARKVNPDEYGLSAFGRGKFWG